MRAPPGRPPSRPGCAFGSSAGGTGGCSAAALGPPGHACCAISSQAGRAGAGRAGAGKAAADRAGRTCSGMDSEPVPPWDGAGAWVQGKSLFGSAAGSQGGRPDTCGARDWRGDWVSRLLIRATPAAPEAGSVPLAASPADGAAGAPGNALPGIAALRSEEHTSELQSHVNLVCRLLLE